LAAVPVVGTVAVAAVVAAVTFVMNGPASRCAAAVVIVAAVAVAGRSGAFRPRHAQQPLVAIGRPDGFLGLADGPGDRMDEC